MAGAVYDGLLDGVLELMVRKKEMAARIKSLTLEQAGFLAPEQAEKLLELVDKKQACIDEIGRIDGELQQLKEKAGVVDGVPEQEGVDRPVFQKRERIEKMRREIDLILREAWHLDEQNRRRLEAEFCRIKSSLKSLQAGRKTFTAYQGAAAPARGCFIDKKK
ncbi:MAG: flagellar protein FlgN [Pelotomaculum sp.]|nr:flagellar protein FlgN [Pelotomaculum sp.]